MFSSVWPCAVPINCTPRSAIVRAAKASASVPISSITTTCGMWFSTASTMTLCCSAGIRDLHAPRAADAGMRNIAVARDLVRRIDDHDALAISAQDARALAQASSSCRRPAARADRSIFRCARRRAGCRPCRRRRGRRGTSGRRSSPSDCGSRRCGAASSRSPRDCRRRTPRCASTRARYLPA